MLSSIHAWFLLCKKWQVYCIYLSLYIWMADIPYSISFASAGLSSKAPASAPTVVKTEPPASPKHAVAAPVNPVSSWHNMCIWRSVILLELLLFILRPSHEIIYLRIQCPWLFLPCVLKIQSQETHGLQQYDVFEIVYVFIDILMEILGSACTYSCDHPRCSIESQHTGEHSFYVATLGRGNLNI